MGMRRTGPAVVLAILVVLAGCSLPGFGSSDGKDEQPPGIENDRLNDVGALLEAHNRSAIAAGFESDFRINGTTTFRGEVVELRQRQRTIVEPGVTEYRYRFTKNVPTFRSDVWGNRTTEAVRLQSSASTKYNVTTQTTSPRTLTATQTLGTLIGGRNFTVESVDRTNGTVLYTLRASGQSSLGFHIPDNATNIENYTATLVVDKTGRVRSFRASRDYRLAGQAGSMEVSYRLIRIGDVPVDRPGWVSEAFQAAG